MRKLIEITNGVVGNPDKKFREPINFTLLEGEQLAIVGNNGAGKSRFAEILGYSLLLEGDAIKYDFPSAEGRMITDSVRYISFKDSYGTADSSYFLQQRWESSMIDEEAVPTVSASLGVRTSAVIDILGLAPLMERRIISLSSGELRKLKIAKAILKMPRMLVIDNPFIGLDIQAREDFSNLLKTLIEKEDLTVVLVLADPDTIPDFITHVVLVDNLVLGAKIPKQEYNYKSSYAIEDSSLQQILSLPETDLGSFYPSISGAEIVKCNKVSIEYDGTQILRPLDWTVREGERWLLTGRNGSGKSTLLSLVCADNPQSYACDIELFSHKRGTGESIWEIKRHIGYVSPELQRAYRKDISALRVVASGLFETMGLFHKPDDKQSATALFWMKIFAVEQLADRSFLSLSDGEQRLCLLARAFVKDPQLLVLDEPFHGLDPDRRSAVMQIIDTFVKRKHKTLLFVSHYLSEVPSCIDHHLELVRGQ